MAASLAARGGDLPCIVRPEEPRGVLRVGATISLRESASGRVLLAYLDPALGAGPGFGGAGCGARDRLSISLGQKMKGVRAALRVFGPDVRPACNPAQADDDDRARPPVLSRLVAHADRHLSLKQISVGSLLIGGGWSAGLGWTRRTAPARPLRWAMEGNAWVAQRVLPVAAQFHRLQVWAGMNVNIDGAPILGEMPGAPGFYNCVTSNGYTLAPVVARMTAELMTRGRAGIDPSPFTLDRF